MIALLSLLLQSGVDWRSDYDRALAEAREKDRLLVVHFYRADRPICKTMEQETFAQAEVVRSLSEKFVSVRLDVEAKPELFESTVGSRGVLATVVLDAGGDVVSQLRGFAGAPVFLRFLARAQGGYAALKSAREAASASPKDPDLLIALAEAYRRCDSPERAVEYYSRALEGAGLAGTAAALCHERLARLKIARGINLDARKHLDAARSLDPEGKSTSKDGLLLTEGLILAVERKHVEAAAVLRSALQQYPASDEADHLMYSLGFVLHQVNQDKPALEVLEDAARRYPSSSWLAAIQEQIDHIKNPQPDHTH